MGILKGKGVLMLRKEETGKYLLPANKPCLQMILQHHNLLEIATIVLIFVKNIASGIPANKRDVPRTICL